MLGFTQRSGMCSLPGLQTAVAQPSTTHRASEVMEMLVSDVALDLAMSVDSGRIWADLDLFIRILIQTTHLRIMTACSIQNMT